MNKRQNDSQTSKKGPNRPQKRHKSGSSRDRPRFKIPLIENWLLIFLRSGKHFFYNKDTKQSVWEAPDHVDDFLYNNVDQNLVLVLLARARGLRKKDDVYWRVGEDTLYQRVRSSGVETTKTVKDESAEKTISVESEKTLPEDDTPGIADTGIASTAPTAPAAPTAHESDSEEFSSSDESEGENNGIDFSALLSDDEGEEEIKENVGPSEDAKNTFKELLDAHNVNPFSTWDKELTKVVEDDRYEVLETRLDRENVFTEWAKDVIRQRKEAKEAEAEDEEELEVDISAAEEFVMLLKETYKKNKFYVEYRRKNKGDERFKEIDLTDKERESVYRAYSKVAGTKKKERVAAFKKVLEDNKALINAETNLGNLHTSISNDIACMVLDIEDRAELLEEFVAQLTSGQIESVEEAKKKRQQRLLYEKSKAAHIARKQAEWGIEKGKKRLDKQNRDLDREVKKLGMEGLKSQLERS
ncbi:hypothetical protein CJU90_4289 [Yarrowia sp. C11]|nr:hypothetical protein CKK34_6572 [Yarrowia sp. E02]KAG5365226.1 hypothetical protein CJU90_4289 [Yarrowia sp. C11]